MNNTSAGGNRVSVPRHDLNAAENVARNVVPISSAKGFTRMDNELIEAMAAVDLPARELRLLMAIARQTIGYQLKSKRMSAVELGKLTNMRRDVTSKAISHLLERGILFREGGCRGEIGIAPVNEWAFFDVRPKRLTETKVSHSDKIVSLRNSASETKTSTSLLYRKKEPPITLPSEEIITPQAPEAQAEPQPKPDRKAPFGKSQMLADNPHSLVEQSIVDYLALRKAKRAPVTARVWAGVNAELAKCLAVGIKPDDAVSLAVTNGWQGFESEWIIKRLAKQPQRFAKQDAPDFHSGDTSWANDLGMF